MTDQWAMRKLTNEKPEMLTATRAVWPYEEVSVLYGTVGAPPLPTDPHPPSWPPALAVRRISWGTG